MVFLTKRMTRTITVEPAYLGVYLKQHVSAKLLREVEGMPMDEEGYVVAVTQVDDKDMKHGLVDALDGSVKYAISFDALIFRPFKNEVLDAVVSSVSEIGFFAEAGPLNILVSQVHMPGDLMFIAEDASWTSSDTGVKIRADSAVRIKVVGASVIQSALCAIGSINEAFLGLLA